MKDSYLDTKLPTARFIVKEPLKALNTSKSQYAGTE